MASASFNFDRCPCCGSLNTLPVTVPLRAQYRVCKKCGTEYSQGDYMSIITKQLDYA